VKILEYEVKPIGMSVGFFFLDNGPNTNYKYLIDMYGDFRNG
jgi:hypothetical protein